MACGGKRTSYGLRCGHRWRKTPSEYCTGRSQAAWHFSQRSHPAHHRSAPDKLMCGGSICSRNTRARRSYDTGNELLEMCTNPDPTLRTACSFYIAGVHDAMVAAESFGQGVDGLRVCVEPGVNTGQLADIRKIGTPPPLLLSPGPSRRRSPVAGQSTPNRCPDQTPSLAIGNRSFRS
jgi:hypothetical protein